MSKQWLRKMKAGEMEGREALFGRALEIASKIKSAVDKARALGSIAGGLASAGEMELWKLCEGEHENVADWSYDQGRKWKNQYSKALFGIYYDSDKLNVKSEKLYKDEVCKSGASLSFSSRAG